MDYYKFEDLLKTSELYFSRIDKQNDNHEGKILVEPPFSEVEFFRTPYEGLSKNTYISCWRMDYNLNNNIWDEYCNNSDSIAIESTYKKLCDSIIICERDIIIGIVEYEYDENKLKEEMNYIYMFKLPEYKWEAELRAVIPLQSYLYSSKDGKINPGEVPDDYMRVLINLDTLIYRVHISPKATLAFANKVKTLIDRCPNLEVFFRLVGKNPISFGIN